MATHLQNPPPAPVDPALDEDDSIDLMHLLVRLLAEWRTGVLVFALVLLAGALKVFSLKSQFVASASILPQQQATEASGLASLFGAHGTNDVYVALLGSRTVANEVISRLDLQHVLGTPTLESTQKALAAASSFANSGTLITISVRQTDADLATRIANAYIDALGSQQDRMNSAEAARQQRFFEAQLEKERRALSAAEDALRNGQQSSGMIAADTQTQIGLSAIAQARSEITGLQVQLAALLERATEQNPQVRTLRSQIAALTAKERSLEAGRGGSGAGAAPSAGRLPQLNLDIQRLQRNVSHHEALYNSLSNSYEAARLSAAESSPQYEVVDRAIVPEERSWPPRALYLALALGAALLAGFFAVLLKLLLGRLRSDARQMEHLRAIRHNFRLRRRV